MGHSEGRWTAATAASDMEIFVGASKFIDTAGFATIAYTAGKFTWHVPATDASIFVADIGEAIRRTGEYATAAGSQSQFGTAASQPGPSKVAGTSGPLALKPGYPPLTAAQLATLGNIQTGPIPKGIQINSFDVIYTVAGLAAAVATCGILKTVFANNVAPAVTNIVAVAANGLPTAIQANPYLTNVLVPSPAMITDSQAEILGIVNLTSGATGTVDFYGINLHCSFNYQ